MKQMTQLIILCFFLLTSVGCQKYDLMNEEEQFSTDGSSFSFRLPSGWQVEKDYKEVFNEAALFGAEDTNSRSVMFIRAQKSEQLNEQQLVTQTKTALKQYYLVDEVEEETFQIANFSAVYYPLKSVYDNRAVWLDNYFIATETHVVEFLFYRPRQGGTEGQQEIIRQSVETLKQLETTASSEEKREEITEQKVTTDMLSIQLTGHKIQGDKLILRYVLTNNSEKQLIPLKEWEELMEVTEAGSLLDITKVTDESDSELTYLQERSSQRLPAGDSVETVVVYELQQDQGDITIQADEQRINGDKPVVLKIER